MFMRKRFSLPGNLIRCRNNTGDIRFFDHPQSEILQAAGYTDFSSLWSLPKKYVDEVNFRRKGWSGVSILTLQDKTGTPARFYIKRQENQRRYSLKYPLGELSYKFEAETINSLMQEKLPCVEMLACGSRCYRGDDQGLIVSKAIESSSLADYRSNPHTLLNHHAALALAGEQLFHLHQSGWQHGAFYPCHLFINFSNGSVRLIDFERARRVRYPIHAAAADLFQFFKRTDWLPAEVIEVIFHNHFTYMPGLIRLLDKRLQQQSVNFRKFINVRAT